MDNKIEKSDPNNISNEILLGNSSPQLVSEAENSQQTEAISPIDSSDIDIPQKERSKKIAPFLTKWELSAVVFLILILGLFLFYYQHIYQDQFNKAILILPQQNKSLQTHETMFEVEEPSGRSDAETASSLGSSSVEVDKDRQQNDENQNNQTHKTKIETDEEKNKHAVSPSKVASIVENLKSGDKKTITINEIEYTFCYCPPGKFSFGSPSDEEGHEPIESIHEITIKEGFWLLETEVTQAMWQSVMKTNPSFFKDDETDLPVERVSWKQCQEFCSLLSEIMGETVSLPTEIQWEYACRAGSNDPIPGNGKLEDIGWVDLCSDNCTHGIKQKVPNDWGFYDMIGNVSEWCSNTKEEIEEEWVGKKDSAMSEEVSVRGGNWHSSATDSRSANRRYYDPKVKTDKIGFRILIKEATTTEKE